MRAEVDTRDDQGAYVRVVILELDGRRYGLPIWQVVEMVRMVAVTPLPSSPDWVTGVINLRGQTIPVIDLRRRFGLEPEPYGLDTPLCIVRAFDRLMAVVPDAAVEVIEVHERALDEPDELAGHDSPIAAVARSNGYLVPILALERICGGAETLTLPSDDYDAA
jgi:purine-binding chemotaxis protein CheW